VIEERSNLIEAFVRTFEALRSYIYRTTELERLRSAADDLVKNARNVKFGILDIPPPLGPPGRVPSREHAAQIMTITNLLPPVRNLDSATTLALGRLIEHLVVGMTGSIIRDFPDIFHTPSRVEPK
jgi:hypothetical protein